MRHYYSIQSILQSILQSRVYSTYTHAYKHTTVVYCTVGVLYSCAYDAIRAIRDLYGYEYQREKCMCSVCCVMCYGHQEYISSPSRLRVRVELHFLPIYNNSILHLPSIILYSALLYYLYCLYCLYTVLSTVPYLSKGA